MSDFETLTSIVFKNHSELCISQTYLVCYGAFTLLNTDINKMGTQSNENLWGCLFLCRTDNYIQAVIKSTLANSYKRIRANLYFMKRNMVEQIPNYVVKYLWSIYLEVSWSYVSVMTWPQGFGQHTEFLCYVASTPKKIVPVQFNECTITIFFINTTLFLFVGLRCS